MTSYAEDMRKHIGSRRLFVPGVRAVIVNDREELLLQRRTDTALWGLPGGGVELDETVFEALKREVVEETALEVTEAEPMGLYSGPNHRFAYPNGDRVQCFALAFLIRKWEGSPRADGREGSAVQFFPLSRLPEDLVPLHHPTIDDYSRYEGTLLLSH